MLIDEYRGRLCVARMCELLGVSTSAYYGWVGRDRVVGNNDTALAEKIRKIVLEFAGYGYRRVTAELKRRGHIVNHKHILRIMQENKLTKKKKRRYIAITDSAHGLKVYPNLAKGFVPTEIDRLWVADITYVRLQQGFVYLAVIVDVFSRRVVGWALRDYLHHELSLAALRMALVRRSIRPGLLHHSDRGVQYVCHDYVELLLTNSIAISMSRSGNPYDNAFAESFMTTLKKEEVNLSEYEDIFDALGRIGYFIEDVYNCKPCALFDCPVSGVQSNTADPDLPVMKAA